jgi:hypothetical protein
MPEEQRCHLSNDVCRKYRWQISSMAFVHIISRYLPVVAGTSKVGNKRYMKELRGS